MLERLRSEQAGPFVIAGGVGLAVIFLSIVALIVSEGYEAVYYQYAASKAKSDAKYRFQIECSQLSSLEELRRCFDDVVGETREPQRSEEDLKAQKDMGRYAFWMVLISGFIGVLTVFVTAVGVYFVRETLAEAGRTTLAAICSADAAQEAVNEAKRATAAAEAGVVETRRIGEAGARAYVYGRKAFLEYNGSECKISLTCVNTGHTPAPYFRVGSTSEVRVVPVAGRVVIPTDLNYSTWTGLGGGGEDIVAAYPDDMGRHIEEANAATATVVTIFAGRVIYNDVFGDEWESEFAFFIRPPVLPGKYKMSRTVAGLNAFKKRDNG